MEFHVILVMPQNKELITVLQICARVLLDTMMTQLIKFALNVT